MKRLALFSCFLFFVAGTGPALAQNPGYPGVPGNMNAEEMMRRFQDPAAMQRMQEQAQKAQQCMEGIDQKKLDALQKRAMAASKEIETLCANGKKAEALKKGIALSAEMRSDTTIKKLRECTKEMSEAMQGMMPKISPVLEDDSEPTDSDICS